MLYCMLAYSYVMWGMGKMIQSAIVESDDPAQRQGLYFIYYATLVIWSAFVVIWFWQELGVLSIYRAEVGNMWANFGAKVWLQQLSNVSWVSDRSDHPHIVPSYT